jgi:hypothetical protein
MDVDSQTQHNDRRAEKELTDKRFYQEALEAKRSKVSTVKRELEVVGPLCLHAL